jgi:hypothetical protein
MNMLFNSKDTIAQIAQEASKLDPLEQQMLLTKIRVARLRKKGVGRVTNPKKKIPKPTLRQIDKWKHESRVKSS